MSLSIFSEKTVLKNSHFPRERPNSVYGLPHNRKKLTDSLAVGDAPAVVYPASVVGSYSSRADMESASPKRQSLRTAGKLPEELSASVSVG